MKLFRLPALALCVCLTNAAGANLLDDGHFDLSTDGTQTSNSAWVLNTNFTSGGESAQFWHNGAAGTDTVGTKEGVWFKSFLGTMDDGQPFANATLSQHVDIGQAANYFMSFDAKREANFTAQEWYVRMETAESGSVTLDLLLYAPNDGDWHTYNMLLPVFSPGETLVVSAVMVNGEFAVANPQSAFVDNFVLTQVPEPTSFALLGLGGLLIAGRRWG